MTGSGASPTRQRIIDATLTLMLEHGLSGVTMTAVADTAGVARQTLYNHFPDVEQIVAAALEAHQTDDMASLRAVLLTIDRPQAQLEHLVRHAAATGVHHPPLAGVHHGLSATGQARLRDHERSMHAVIEDVLRAGIADGSFRSGLVIDRDAALIRHMLVAVTEMAHADPESVAEIAAAASQTVTAAVRR